jgi:curved DNA-binding protein CbpA
MPPSSRDPYQTLGVKANASDAELRAAYRRLVQIHHPDHNGGSADSARRFEEVQEAYARVRELRGTATGSPRTTTGSPKTTTGSPKTTTGSPRTTTGSTWTAPGYGSERRSRARSNEPSPQAGFDPKVEARLAALERELLKAQVEREEARRAARRAAERSEGDRRPTDEELGYVSTTDSFTKIIDDAAAELTDRFSQARKSPAGRRLSDLIDELGAKLTGEPPDHKP